MEIQVSGKNGKYTVVDKNGKLLYNVKKKGFGAKFNLMDINNYNLYTLVQTGSSKSPTFTIILNDNVFMVMQCTSLYLDPSFKVRHKTMNFEINSKNRKDFDIILDGKNVGSIKTLVAVTGDLQYHVTIENTAFDDYIPLFAVAVDRAFGEMNK
ncbi:MAG: LURP-one-related family protein [Ruminococcus sp.]|uniref:LURP-one-related family protein n=1 Tax=Ruminococcus sp. TaxID=41978 RepID=UPI0025E3D6C1|nr:LURP-one-related family protein [Ruminococcus sp.]MCR5599565.1 LURP-one-related family protein [Ruminococcus sp.]